MNEKYAVDACGSSSRVQDRTRPGKGAVVDNLVVFPAFSASMLLALSLALPQSSAIPGMIASIGPSSFVFRVLKMLARVQN